MSREDFDTDSAYKVQLVKELLEIANELGWQVALPSQKEQNEEVPGLIIGQGKYVNKVLDCLAKGKFKHE